MPVEGQIQAQARDGFYCEQYNSIHTESGNYFKNYQFLGKGGNGVAYLVQATSGELKGGLFVLKGFHKNSDKIRLRRFLEERTFLKNNIHPNLMRLVDEGEYYNSRPFVVQPYMPHTLRQELSGRALPFGKALSFSCQLLSAVQALQKKDMIHRDIKPENVFVNGAQVLLGDFGLIKEVSDTPDDEDINDLQGYQAGAYFYRTPELAAYAKGEKGLDLRSDIFQLGLVIAEMFSGRNPLSRAENFTDDLELSPISHIKSKHAGLVVNAINAMLAENPDDRASIEDCLDAFTGIFETYAKDCYELHEKVILE